MRYQLLDDNGKPAPEANAYTRRAYKCTLCPATVLRVPGNAEKRTIKCADCLYKAKLAYARELYHSKRKALGNMSNEKRAQMQKNQP